LDWFVDFHLHVKNLIWYHVPSHHTPIYVPPTTIGVIKSRRMSCAGHLVGMRERTDVYRVLVGKPEGRRPLGRLSH